MLYFRNCNIRVGYVYKVFIINLLKNSLVEDRIELKFYPFLCGLICMILLSKILPNMI